MAEPKTIARPYARAAFAVAQANNEIDLWQQTLASLGPLSSDQSLRASLYGPLWMGRRIAEEILAFINSKGNNNERIACFVTCLAEACRLPLLEHIHRLFEQYVAEASGHVQATIESAHPLEEAEKSSLTTALEKHLGKSADATYKTNKDLLGGVIIRIGDTVMDATLRSSLMRLEDTLKH